MSQGIFQQHNAKFSFKFTEQLGIGYRCPLAKSISNEHLQKLQLGAR
jgi:hypothetical protein